MAFWEDLKCRLNKQANFDAHEAGLKAGGIGSQILVPTHFNDGSAVDPKHHEFAKKIMTGSGLSHEAHQATGGWMSPEHGLMTEGITVHRGYGGNSDNHTRARETMLPYINGNLKQEASLGTFDGPKGNERLKPFSFKSLQARMPINLDVNGPKNENYRNLIGGIAQRHGGFTHYSLPQGNQLELHSENPNDLGVSQDEIEKFLIDHHGKKGSYSYKPTNAYLSPADSNDLLRTASLHETKHIIGPIRNMIHALRMAADNGSQKAHEYLVYLGIDTRA